MKKISSISILLLAMLLASCNEDPKYFELPVYPDEMHVKCSTEEIVLNKGIADETAITLTWDKATSPLSASDVVTYKVCFYPSTMKDQKSAYIETGTQTTLSVGPCPARLSA